MARFDQSIIHVGDWCLCRGRGGISEAIEVVEGSWASHGALIVVKDNEVGIGQTNPPRSEWQPLSWLESRINDGTYQVRVLRPTGATWQQGVAASRWWLDHVEGHWYNFLLDAWLGIKDWWRRRQIMAAYMAQRYGTRAAWPLPAYECFEGCAAAWLHGAGLNLLGTDRVGPRAVEDALAAGVFVEVPNAVIED